MEEDSFIFVKSITTDDRSNKGPKWSKGTYVRAYNTQYDEDKEWIAQDMKDQINSTVSSFEKAELKDKDKVYLVLGVQHQFLKKENQTQDETKDETAVRKQVFYKNTLDVLKRIKAEILCYLNSEHTNLLITCQFSDLTHILNKCTYRCKYFKNTVKRLGPLLPKEQISEHLVDNNWKTEPKEVLIELVPNVPTETKNQHAKTLIQYFNEKDKSASSCCDDDFIITKLDQTSTQILLKKCNYIFRVTEVPQGMLQEVKIPRKRKTKEKPIKGKASSAGKQKSRFPVVCLLDSGVNEIPQLNQHLITPIDGYRTFSSFGDDYRGNGHGTPIAYLTVFGDNAIEPKARIVSYKIYSHYNRSLYPESYQLAIQKYSNEYSLHYSKIFVSSINFTKNNDSATAKIDRYIQENNICMVFASGNIDHDTVLDYAQKHVPCKAYIKNHHVQDPAQALNGIAIGAIAKKQLPGDTMVRIDELSPFTTCGTTNGCLYDCEKPEFVEHGGNLFLDGTPLGLTSFNKFGKVHENFVGTSFASPLFAHCLAEIFGRYGHKFENAETLKAIAFALSHGQRLPCKGYGETKPLNHFNYNLQALICSEGQIPLTDIISDKHFNIGHRGQVTIFVPNNVNSIKLFLVHSDNDFLESSPRLNTYLKVEATKVPHDSNRGRVDCSDPTENDLKTNMKVFEWAFPVHSMGGKWTFTIKPELTADISPQHKRVTTIRYGCAILLSSKTSTRRQALTREVRENNQDIGAVI